MSNPEFPQALFEEKFDKMFSDKRPSDRYFTRGTSGSRLDMSRRTDIKDTFTKFRGTVADMLSNLGIEAPEAIDEVTLYVAMQERSGFESGVGFVHDNAVVTSKQNDDRSRSILHNMKTAGL